MTCVFFDYITQNEFIDYFNEHEQVREWLFAKLESENKEKNLWDRYRNVIIKPYSNRLSNKGILEVCVRNAPLYGVKRRCIAEYDYSKCFDCSVFENCFLRECYTTYLYLNIRDTILNGIFSYECEKYRELLESGENEKIDSIRRLISNIDK